MSIELLGLTLGNETISLKEPSSMVITRAWDSPAWQLDITLPHEGPLDDLTKIQVKHGTDALFAGLCDEIVRSVDGNGAFVSISARTPGALLCDNEALPKTYTDLTAQAYFNAELKTLGFTGLSLPNTTASAATFQLGKGHSVWEAFCILCFRLYGREPHITAGNTVVVETLTGDDPIIISNAVKRPGCCGTARWSTSPGGAARFLPLFTGCGRGLFPAIQQSLWQRAAGAAQPVHHPGRGIHRQPGAGRLPAGDERPAGAAQRQGNGAGTAQHRPRAGHLSEIHNKRQPADGGLSSEDHLHRERLPDPAGAGRPGLHVR